MWAKKSNKMLLRNVILLHYARWNSSFFWTQYLNQKLSKIPADWIKQLNSPLQCTATAPLVFSAIFKNRLKTNKQSWSSFSSPSPPEKKNWGLLVDCSAHAEALRQSSSSSFHDSPNYWVTRGASINKEEVKVINAMITESFCIIEFLVKSDNCRHIVLLEIVNVRFWCMQRIT